MPEIVPKIWLNFGSVYKSCSLTDVNLFILFVLVMVEAAGVELSGVLTARKLLILGSATMAKKAPLPDPLYVYCTKK
jgi:hypothetical protein